MQLKKYRKKKLDNKTDNAAVIYLEECVQASEFFTQRVRVDVNKELSRGRERGTSERPVPERRDGYLGIVERS
jgi:hypothetical protein